MKPTPIPTRSVPELPSPTPLPSGPPYVRPMKITAINSLICYTYELNWYDSGLTITTFELNTNRALNLSYPSPPKRDSMLDAYKVFTQQWLGVSIPRRQRYFRTIDDVYLDAFMNHKCLHTTHDEFPRIQSIYPEYFI